MKKVEEIELIRSFSNKHIADKLNSEANQEDYDHTPDSPMFKTSQK